MAATLPAAFQATVAAHGDALALRTRGGAQELTWRRYGERVREVAARLAGLGVERGGTFGLLMANRPEFNVVDTAAAHLGATCFSLYATSSPEQIAYLLEDAGFPVVVSEPALAERARAAGTRSRILLHDELDALPPLDGFDFERAWRSVRAEDVACLIYTSGTTGPPKGVQLTHANVLAELAALRTVYPYAPGDSLVSFLPHAHIADRALCHYASFVIPLELTLCPDPREVLSDVADRRPTLFGAVPRVWEKLKAGLEAAGVRDPAELPAEARAAVRARIGFDRVRLAMSGAAPIAPEALEFFAALDIPICEVWGMSETTAVATITPPDRPRPGTVGPPLPGVEVRLAEDGEVMVRGPIVMTGYRNQPEKTREAFTADGWLLTGDIGAWDEEGYLRIVDRKKELIINAAGKNMSPANIEQHLKAASPLVGQVYVHGDRRPYNVALVVLDPDVAPGWDGDREAEVAAAVERANAKLSRVEQVKRFRVLDTDWLPGGDELTPTMKLKRRPIADKYAAELECLYA